MVAKIGGDAFQGNLMSPCCEFATCRMSIPQASWFRSWINKSGSDHLLQPGPVHRLVLFMAPEQSPAQQSGLRVSWSGWNCVTLHIFLIKFFICNLIFGNVILDQETKVQLYRWEANLPDYKHREWVFFSAHFQQINLCIHVVDCWVENEWKHQPLSTAVFQYDPLFCINAYNQK